jgi:hypothetical protein
MSSYKRNTKHGSGRQARRAQNGSVSQDLAWESFQESKGAHDYAHLTRFSSGIARMDSSTNPRYFTCQAEVSSSEKQD